MQKTNFRVQMGSPGYQIKGYPIVFILIIKLACDIAVIQIQDVYY